MTKMQKSLVALVCLLMIGCSESNDPRYFDYSGNDGCSPPNIGHRLGGDLEKYSDNSIEGLRGIEGQQQSRCFKNWEFDLTESADGLVLLNSSNYNGLAVADLSVSDLPDGVVPPSQLISEFSRIVAIKPVVIDLKVIRSPQALRDAKRVAENLAASQDVEIWFIASEDNARQMPEVCAVLGADFDLLLYSRGGIYCGSGT